jgi:GT2 family glycosyltransferase
MPARPLTAQTLPPTSLIIPSRGRPDLLLETVQSILAGDQVPSELVIIDQSDAAHPGLMNLTTERQCRIRYQKCEPWGVSYGRNQGIRSAEHELLILIDDDVLVEPGWLRALVSALVAGGPNTVVTGQVRPAEAETPGSFVPSTRTDATPSVYTKHADEDVLFSNNMALYRSAIDRVGPFDERLGPGTHFGTAEDNDLGFRLLEANYRIYYVPEAVLYHRSWRPAQDFVPLRWNYGFGRGAFYAKHLSLKNPHMLRRMLKDIASHLMSGMRRLRTDRQQSLGDIVLAVGILLGAPGWLIAANWGNPRTQGAAAGHGDQQTQSGRQV